MSEFDQELLSMNQIAKILDAIEEVNTRSRIIEWLVGRYGIGTASYSIESANSDSPSSDTKPAMQTSEVEMFSDLYYMVNPRTDMQRALVGGYWQQVKSEQQSWGSFTVNKLLKDVGYGVGSISHRLNDARRQKPALLQQVSKSGKSRQARKTYRLTQAGIKYVEEMTRGVEL